MLFRKTKKIYIHTFDGRISLVKQGVDVNLAEITINCSGEIEKTFSAYLGTRHSELHLEGKDVALYVVESNSYLTIACIFFWKSHTSMTLDIRQKFTKKETKIIENQVSNKIRKELS